MRDFCAYILALTVGLMVGACSSEENNLPSGLGSIKLSFAVEEVPGAEPVGPFALTIASADGQYSHTWPNVANYQEIEPYYVGHYRASVVSGDSEAEGYGCPCYMGETDFEVLENQIVTVPIAAQLAQCMATATIAPEVETLAAKVGVTLHTDGHGYVSVDPSHAGPMFLSPGSTTAMVTLERGDGKSVTVQPDFAFVTQAGGAYDVIVGADGTALTLACGQATAKMEITDEIYDAPAPQIAASGFEPGKPLILSEGYPSVEPKVMTVSASMGLKTVTLVAAGSSSVLAGLPAECDLLSLPQAWAEAGVEVAKVSDQETKVDFTRLLETLNVNQSTHLQFTVVATDRLGRVSEPSVLAVEIKSLEFEVVSQTQAVIGYDAASVMLSYPFGQIDPHDFAVVVPAQGTEPDETIAITGCQVDADKRLVTLQLSVPEGIKPVEASIVYMGGEKARVTIERKVPEYEFLIDAFATSATLMIKDPNALVAQAIAKYASVMVDGKEAAVYSREVEQGVIRIMGLTPGKNYSIEPVVIAGQYAPQIKVRTEEALPVPDGDLETSGPLIKYPGLPSGGIYSNTIFPIYSMQNFSDIDVTWPREHWASVNAKTFCMRAKNKNTWYMQPSSANDFESFVSGYKSVRMQSVGWSVDGEEIPPYCQAEGEQLPYNANMPSAVHHAAGRLFLGSYSFDASTLTETYAEGEKFASRPSSLNGFYKYTPDPTATSDYGWLEIELINDDADEPIVVARSTYRFESAPDFIAFNVPIEYKVLGVKATRLKIMFASSDMAGDIEQEDAKVPVSADVPGARFVGSVLWVDNLSFAY